MEYRYKGTKTLKLDKLKKIPRARREVSIILPTYNEEENTEKLVRALETELKDIDFEIIIVDDDSKDKTPEIMDKLAGERIIALHRYGERGLLSAFLDGIFISNGKYIVTMDSDFSHPPEIITKMWEYRKDHDIVSGSRFVKGGDMKAFLLRKGGSILINKTCASIMGIDLKDLTGNFHLINKKKFNQIEFKYRALFGEFDFELLYRATKLGFKIKEIPFIYKFRSEGSSKMGNLISYAWAYFKMAFKLRFKH
jgi:dolichol-phosphate mannosyltransferase